MQARQRPRCKNLLEELHTSEEKVTLLKDKHETAKGAIKDAKELMKEAQIILDQMTVNYQRKVKRFRLLDEILAEFKFSLKARELEKKKNELKAKRLTKGKKIKTSEEILADVMACLEALPADQRAGVIKAMENQQQGELR